MRQLRGGVQAADKASEIADTLRAKAATVTLTLTRFSSVISCVTKGTTTCMDGLAAADEHMNRVSTQHVRAWHWLWGPGGGGEH